MSPRSRYDPTHRPVKPAPNAGLTLFVETGSLESLWTRLVLAEKEIDSARIELIRSDQLHEDFRVLNPQGTLPTLADREGVISGARVIAEYLNERYPHPPLMPLGPALRAHVRMRMQRLEMEVFPTLVTLKPGSRLPVKARQALADVFRQYRSSGPQAAEINFSLADCAWTALFWQLRQVSIALPKQVSGLSDWAAALLARPAVTRAKLT